VVPESSAIADNTFWNHYKLVTKGVIVSWEFFVRNAAIGVQGYLLLLNVANSTLDFERRLYQACASHPHVIGFGKRVGAWNFEVYIEVSSVVDLELSRIHLLSSLGDSILDCSIHIKGDSLKWDWSDLS
jgi:hypothetical protein